MSLQNGSRREERMRETKITATTIIIAIAMMASWPVYKVLSWECKFKMFPGSYFYVTCF